VFTKFRPGGGEFGALLFLVSLFALYGNLMPFGIWGYLLGACLGVAWGSVLLLIVRRIARSGVGRSLADATLLIAMAGLVAVASAGTLYMLVFGAILGEESTTYAVLSAMMGPTVPFFIVLNGALEMLVMPLVMALNLATSRHGILVGLAALIYWLMRAWTYAVFAEPRVTMSTATLSDADMAWFRDTIATDQRVYMVALAALLLLAAALGRHRASVTRQPASQPS
jgi:hypothetical protein